MIKKIYIAWIALISFYLIMFCVFYIFSFYENKCKKILINEGYAEEQIDSYLVYIAHCMPCELAESSKKIRAFNRFLCGDPFSQIENIESHMRYLDTVLTSKEKKYINIYKGFDPRTFAQLDRKFWRRCEK